MSSTPSKSQSDIRLKSQTPRLKSVGTRLFLLVMGGALIGLGGMAYLFYENLRKGAEEEIQVMLDGKVAAIDGQMKEAEALSRAFRDSVATLHNQGVKDPDAYRKLVLELFKGRPESVIGMGFGQDAYGIISDRQWFYPYYQIDPGTPDAPGVKLAPPNDNLRYIGEDQPGDFYPEQDYWKDYMATQKTLWGPPTEYFGVFYTNFYLPIYNAKKKWIGSLTVDYNAASFNEVLKSTVIRNTGNFAMLDAKNGIIIAYPPDSQKAVKGETYQAIPQLASAWSQVTQEKPGLVLVNGTYWAYQRLPQAPDWVVLASLPSHVVLDPVLLIAVGGTLTAGLLIGIAVFLATRYLNRRLQPILDECNKLAATDAQTQAQIEREDEIGRLSVSFFNLIDRLATKEEQIRQEVARTVQTEEQLKQSTEAQKEGETLAQDVGQLLDVVAAVEDGDLTIQAPVNDRVTGLVSDTFNRLIEQLAQILGQVANTAQQVTLSSQQLDESAQTVSFNVQQQAQDISNVLTLTEQVQSSARSSANQIDLANQSLTQVKTTIEQGQLAINALSDGIQTLQTGASQIVTRTHDLDEFVTLTNQFVQEQGQLAELIQSLAMGATLLSARATAQQDPRQMMVLAKEFETIANQIKGLAEQTNQNLGFLRKRTDKMQGTVTSIAQNLQDIDVLVNNFTQEVNKSTQAFSSIQSSTESAIATGEAVSQSSQAIVQTAQTTALEMGDIARLADQTAQLTQTARSQSEQMGQISKELLQRIQFFRLPEEASERADLSQSQTSTVEVTPTLTSP
jgi:methyl-accepting chemotaxis protein PixJ